MRLGVVMAARESTWRPVCDYYDAGHDLDECAAHFDLKRTTVKRYLLERSRATGTVPPREAATRKHTRGVPVDQLSESDRAIAVRTVRNGKNVLDRKLAYYAQQLEQDPSFEVSPRDLAGLRSLADAVRITIDTHPGLMELAAEKQGPDDDGGGRLARIRRALLGRE